MHVVKTVLIVLEVLLIFNLLIFVHELGHFLAARWRGLKVERFAIWFGKPIWKTKIGGVEYCLGSIPAGGMSPCRKWRPWIRLKARAMTRKSRCRRFRRSDKIIVAFAGPLFSFLLAIAFAVVVWIVGQAGGCRPDYDDWMGRNERARLEGWIASRRQDSRGRCSRFRSSRRPRRTALPGGSSQRRDEHPDQIPAQWEGRDGLSRRRFAAKPNGTTQGAAADLYRAVARRDLFHEVATNSPWRRIARIEARRQSRGR